MIDLQQVFASGLKDSFQRIRQQFQIFIKKEMNKGIGTNKKERPKRNMTDKLYVRTGRLLRSFIPGQPDNIDKFSANGGVYNWEFGSKVPYAAIHNFGGTINHPGGTPYVIVGQGLARFITLQRAKELEGKGIHVNFTKAHSINIPARPYFEKAREKVAIDTEKAMLKLIRDFKKTYEAQNVSI